MRAASGPRVAPCSERAPATVVSPTRSAPVSTQKRDCSPHAQEILVVLAGGLWTQNVRLSEHNGLLAERVDQLCCEPSRQSRAVSSGRGRRTASHCRSLPIGQRRNRVFTGVSCSNGPTGFFAVLGRERGSGSESTGAERSGRRTRPPRPNDNRPGRAQARAGLRRGPGGHAAPSPSPAVLPKGWRSIEVPLAGITFHDSGKPALSLRLLELVKLVREPHNPHNPLAVLTDHGGQSAICQGTSPVRLGWPFPRAARIPLASDRVIAALATLERSRPPAARRSRGRPTHPPRG